MVFPFAPATQLDQGVIDSLGEAVGEIGTFEFVLRRLGRFPTTLYLRPEPDSAFIRLTEAIIRRFPEYLPYEGAFDSVLPHLTVAQGNAPLMDEAEADIQGHLPITSTAREAVLLEEIVPDGRRWQVRARLPLAG